MSSRTPSPPSEEHHGNEAIHVGYGRLNVKAQGWNLILAIVMLANIGVTIWTARALRQDFFHAHAQRAAEHREIVTELSRSACLAALTPEERTQFRSGSRSWSRWCWWVRDEPYQGRSPRGDHNENNNDRR